MSDLPIHRDVLDLVEDLSNDQVFCDGIRTEYEKRVSAGAPDNEETMTSLVLEEVERKIASRAEADGYWRDWEK